MNRQNGYYWVKLRGKWVIATYHGTHWAVSGFIYYSDSAFERIYEKRLVEFVDFIKEFDFSKRTIWNLILNIDKIKV
jgi:hypothetical protein